MRKKLLAMIGVLVLAIGMTACTGGNDNTTSDGTVSASEDTDDNGAADNGNGGDVATVTGIESAIGAYNSIWEAYEESEKFSAIGGDMATAVSDAPGAYNLEDKDSLTGLFYVPADYVASIDDAATLMHMMNANTYTGVIAHVSDTEAYASAVKENIVGTEWVCGFPDRLVIADLGEGYVVYAFGEESIMNTFTQKFEQVFPSSKILYDVNLAE